ncbi:hypothetical protein K491DRAFT_778750 [Lophiostoma macrostomum CBS 122681]|uniref:Gfd2/YDR514C-like C-terminal domain-containing protein n=1 Tax=Lophiostoma macrostomum CBS 122681 TaxID=1314788 RepID=A0A6A6T898_9PLEO|nr:hypothetical protein K491DRAFT_778750 [Lophiostoma macrostomum CBS 122681]
MASILNYEDSCSMVLRALGLGNQGEEDLVFVSVDTEFGKYLPKDHSCYYKILEFGLCTLDTRDIRGLEPGLNGANWLKHIRTKHYRMSDTIGIQSDAKDVRGVPLCVPEHFEFGESTVVDRDDIAAAVTDDCRIPDPPSSSVEKHDESVSTKFRKIVLVAQGWHATDSVWWKDQMNLDIDEIGTIEAVIDTQTVFGNEQPTKPGLVKIMKGFNIERLYMHNGANDAVYTLACLVLGILWSHAWKETQKRDWSFMNASFPLMQINGEQAIQVLAGNSSLKQVPSPSIVWSEAIEAVEERISEGVVLRLRGAD